jgi:hypothetical protein
MKTNEKWSVIFVTIKNQILRIDKSIKRKMI